MKQIYEFKVIYGGCLPFYKKDQDGKRTDKQAYMYNLLDVDEEKGFVNSTTYSSDELFDVRELSVLKPCVAMIEMSVGSKFTKLVGLKPIVK